MRAPVTPVKLRRQIIHPTIFKPCDRVRVKVLVLIELDLHIVRKPFPVNSERAYAEQCAWSDRFYRVVQFTDESVDILAAPIPQVSVAAVSCIENVIRERTFGKLWLGYG